MSVQRTSQAALVSEVDTFRMRFDIELAGSVSEDIRDFQTQFNSLLEVLSGYPDIVEGIYSNFNRVLGRIEPFENTVRHGEAGPGSNADVSYQGRVSHPGKK